jgi:hypothetical protein
MVVVQQQQEGLPVNHQIQQQDKILHLVHQEILAFHQQVQY